MHSKILPNQKSIEETVLSKRLEPNFSLSKSSIPIGFLPSRSGWRSSI